MGRRLGGMWAGVSAGLDSIVEGNRARDEMAIRQRAADMAEKRFGLEEQQFNMQKDLHNIKLDNEKRKSQLLDVDELGKIVGAKDPAAYEYGLDHATRSGFIQVDPVTGKRQIRREDLEKTMHHLDSAPGVAEVSKRKITYLEDQLGKTNDPALRAPLERQLKIERFNNEGARKQIELEHQAAEKQKDRENTLRHAAIMKSPGADKPGEAEERKARTEKIKEEARILKEAGSDKGKGEAALAKFLGSDEFTMALGSLTGPAREKREEELIDRFVRNYNKGKEGLKRLGGAGVVAAPGAGPVRKTYNPKTGRIE